MKTNIIPDLVINVLQSAIITDNGIQLQGQLDRKDYMTVNKVLEACGCKWNRKLKLHEFQGEHSRCRIEAAVDSGSYTHEKKAFDFFETPEWVANEMAVLAKLKKGFRVLEPSAGHGCLVRAAFKEESNLVLTAVELRESGREEMKAMALPNGHSMAIIIGDFMYQEWEVRSPESAPFDAVIMNPPFSNSQDIQHVCHAMKFLKRGGRLVAIVSPGYTFREGSRYDAFRKMLDENKLVIEKVLPAGTFKASGTMVRTHMLVIEKK